MTRHKPKRSYDLLSEAVTYQQDAFESDAAINGGDLLAWFADWRIRARRILGRDERELNGMRISNREAASILFALRNLQEDMLGLGGEFRGIMKNAEHFAGGIKPLTLDEIDLLCRRINHG